MRFTQQTMHIKNVEKSITQLITANDTVVEDCFKNRMKADSEISKFFITTVED